MNGASRQESMGIPESNQSHPVRLTRRQEEILSLLVQGLTSRQIAEQLDISLDTARVHVQRLLWKLDAHTRAEAVFKATNSQPFDHPPAI